MPHFINHNLKAVKFRSNEKIASFSFQNIVLYDIVQAEEMMLWLKENHNMSR